MLLDQEIQGNLKNEFSYVEVTSFLKNRLIILTVSFLVMAQQLLVMEQQLLVMEQQLLVMEQQLLHLFCSV